jgi:hypothetical protein
MAYWGNKAEECDYAFDCMGSYIAHMRKAMFSAATGSISEQYPEQSLLVTLKAIHALWEVFPKNVAYAFPRDDFEQSKRLFREWLSVVGRKLSASRKKCLVVEAEQIFAMCEKMYPDPYREAVAEE